MNAPIDDLYARQIKPLPPADRLRPPVAPAQDLVSGVAGDRPDARSLLDLEGLGDDLWRDVDAQAYVHELRDEWDRRP